MGHSDFKLVLFSVLFFGLYCPIEAGKSTILAYNHIGCFKDATIRVLPDYLGDFRKSKTPVLDCARATRQRGFRAFGVQRGGDCWSGPKAHLDYSKWGKSNRCHGNTGGPYDNDIYFMKGRVGVSWQRLSRRKLNKDFDWKGAIQDAMGKTTRLYKAVSDGHVYVLEYPLLDGIPKKAVDVPDVLPPVRGREVMDAVSPVAVFVSRPNRRRGQPNRLVPVAIQMGHKRDSKVYTPDDGDMWLLAKQTVQVADFAQVSIAEHLLKLHFFMEPICVCLNRNLHSLHPLHQIMKFHCRGVLGSKMFGGPMLLAPNGTINKLMTIGLSGSVALLKRAHRYFKWSDMNFYGDLRRRGVLDKIKVPYYPYREDGKLINKAIRSMVSKYVDLYYKDNCDVKHDAELQEFANEVSAKGKNVRHGGNGKIKGFPPFIGSKYHLKDIISRLIWATSAHHSVVNYPSNYLGLYTPSAPTKLYKDTRSDPDEFDEFNLPNKFTAVTQAALGMTLSSMFYDTLFDYGNELKDPHGRKIVEDHRTWLHSSIRDQIELDNVKRFKQSHLPYPYLVPGWIANSIHT